MQTMRCKGAFAQSEGSVHAARARHARLIRQVSFMPFFTALSASRRMRFGRRRSCCQDMDACSMQLVARSLRVKMSATCDNSRNDSDSGSAQDIHSLRFSAILFAAACCVLAFTLRTEMQNDRACSACMRPPSGLKRKTIEHAAHACDHPQDSSAKR